MQVDNIHDLIKEAHKRPEYYGEIRARTATSADIYFYGDIVSRGGWYTKDEDQWPSKIRNLLADVKDVAQLNIYINSGGGSCTAGMAIYNILARHKAHKTVYVDGLAASMASIIALAGDKIVIPENAWMMIHQPWTICWGNANDLEKEISALRTIEKGMMAVYCAKAKQGVTHKALRKMMEAETWLTGTEAAEYFNIETTPAGNVAAWVGSEYYSKYKNAPASMIPKDSAQEPSAPNAPPEGSTQEMPPPDSQTIAESALAKAKLKLTLHTNHRR